MQETKFFSYDGEGWGLTFNGRQLVMSDGTNRLTFRDPETFVVIRNLDVHDCTEPVEGLNELEWIDHQIWANVWRTNRIARINPVTGRVHDWIDLSGLTSEIADSINEGSDLNGIAYDISAGRVFVTGKLWPLLFEVAVASPE